jgi:hypothetical protein
LDRFHYYHRFEFGRRRRDRCNEKLATATRHESTRGFHASGNDPLFVFAVQQADCKTTNGNWVTHEHCPKIARTRLLFTIV